MGWRKSVGLALSAAALPGLAVANPVKSHYTTIELKACTRLPEQDRQSWRCQGLPGYPVYISVAADHTYLSVGRDPARRTAATQSPQPTNRIFSQSSVRATLEWRFERKGSALVPYATILRYFTGIDPDGGQMIVVAKVSRTENCHVAYIDALATSEPIALAHRIADERARNFECTSGPMHIVPGTKDPI
jgi:hypothetical protein